MEGSHGGGSHGGPPWRNPTKGSHAGLPCHQMTQRRPKQSRDEPQLPPSHAQTRALALLRAMRHQMTQRRPKQSRDEPLPLSHAQTRVLALLRAMRHQMMQRRPKPSRSEP